MTVWMTTVWMTVWMTGIEPALSAWELACHPRADHKFAGQWLFDTWPLLSVLHRLSLLNRARSGHAPTCDSYA
jgi:hypothetical protein